MDDTLYKLFVQKMNSFGFDVTAYTQSFFGRRLSVRLRVRNLDEQAYLSSMDRDEADKLYNELFVHVTHLFRDVSAFRGLQEHVIPQLPNSPFIWSAGCSNGSEASTLAILCNKAGKIPKIVGTDIEPDIVNQARQFTFDEQFMKEVPDEFKQHFSVSGENYTLSPELQKFISFEVANILTGTIPAADMVVCRNTVIYFTQEVKQELYMKIHERLNPGGFLMLGKTEVLQGQARDVFETIDTDSRIYRKI